MGTETKIPLKDSIATRMLIVVLGLYLLIALGVSLSHVWFEYRYQKANIIQDLGDIESAFENGLAVSLWRLDPEALQASVEGMLRIPMLVGVKIFDADGIIVARGGTIIQGGKTGSVGFQVQLSGCDPNATGMRREELPKLEMFERQFPIAYVDKGESFPMGRAVIYSSGSVIYRRMKLEVAMLTINVVLTLFTFTMALLWAFNRYLRRPLGILTRATAAISLNSLGTFSVDTKTSRHNEIKVLEDVMTATVADLHSTITKREETEASLRASEAKFRGLVESSSDWIWELNADGVYTYASPQVEAILGFRPEEVVGKSPFDLMPPEEARRVKEVFADVAGNGTFFVALENVNLHKDGRHITLETSGIPVLDEAGKVTGYRGVDRDISERKRAERQFLQNQAQLKSLASELVLAEERERSRIAVYLHDDVCQCLAFAKMKLQLVNASLSDQTQRTELTEAINSVTRVLEEVQTLTFELHSPLLAEFGLAAAISNWATDQIELKHGIRTAFTDDGQAKPLDDEIQALLFRSVRELLINVVKHSRAKQVSISVRGDGEEILICLEDDGIGFAPNKVVIGKETGGFGLFSIRERLNQMGGSLEIDSRPGQGCRSILRAPLFQSGQSNPN
jgi:PAS domain S-box-containing protein